ncbi:hypothetical protein [Neptunomonas sp.]|uniref:hypothetical protein n=1 Tax=Neptunomonas sp. TaxID=1971898 RepID=UPI0025F3C222|nr:hypothetical protein [Neptunomonas sp.]
MLKLFSVIGGIVLLFIWLAPDNSAPPEHQANITPILAPLDAPVQKLLSKSAQNAQPFLLNEYTLQPKAEIHFSARLLGKERYRLGRESDLSPVDLALGWGAMANPQITDNIKISQSNRWFHWKTDQLPIPRRQIETSAANVHIIPANQAVKDQLSRIDEGEILQISGQLVDIQSADGFFWRTSMTRQDVGAGACEIIYATHIDVLPDPF